MYNQLYWIRARQRMTQQELAARARVSRSTICMLERTGGYPSIRVGLRLCSALACRFEEVFPIDVLL